jgi:hypothetical protein
MKPWLSTMPVLGDSKAATHWGASAGSSSRAWAPLSHCTGTPLASARCCKVWRACASAGFMATTSLPQRLWFTP